VQRVGLFVDAPVADVVATLAEVDLDLLQFHGDESAQYCRQFDMPYIKVLGMGEGADFTHFAANYADAWALLLDTLDAQMKGGTGRQFDWTLWPEQSANRLILAGGLTPDNVTQSVRQLRPFGVDVAGGVENEKKGVKDHAKLQHFIENAKNG
jgi:phosphoribosylanthranilate isomerase